MEKGTQRALVRRLLDHVDARTTDRVDTAFEIPVSDYTDTGQFAAELTHIFRRNPLIVGHSSQLADPGTFISDDVYGIPLLVVRTQDGQLRGHVNVCRHRGARLVEDPSGSQLKTIRCRYHGWQYDADGTLKHVPDEGRCFPGLDRARRGLIQVPVWERHGFVWASPGLATNHEQSVDGPVAGYGFGALDSEIGSYQFASDFPYGAETRVGEFNWKIGVEAFLEVYHFRTLHPDMENYFFVPELSLIDVFDEHVRIVAPKREIRDLREADQDQWQIRPHATVVYYLYPGTFLFVEKKHLSTLQIRPLTVDSSEVKVSHFVSAEALARPAALERNLSLFMRVLDEDLGICRSIQLGVHSPQRDVLFGRNEVGLHVFRQSVRAALARRVALNGRGRG